MKGFKNVDNRENILDIIYDYLDIVDDVEEYKQNGLCEEDKMKTFGRMQDEYGKDEVHICMT